MLLKWLVKSTTLRTCSKGGKDEVTEPNGDMPPSLSSAASSFNNASACGIVLYSELVSTLGTH